MKGNTGAPTANAGEVSGLEVLAQIAVRWVDQPQLLGFLARDAFDRCFGKEGARHLLDDTKSPAGPWPYRMHGALEGPVVLLSQETAGEADRVRLDRLG